MKRVSMIAIALAGANMGRAIEASSPRVSDPYSHLKCKPQLYFRHREVEAWQGRGNRKKPKHK